MIDRIRSLFLMAQIMKQNEDCDFF